MKVYATFCHQIYFGHPSDFVPVRHLGVRDWNESPLCESVSVTISSKFVHNFSREIHIRAIRWSPAKSQFSLELIQIRGEKLPLSFVVAVRVVAQFNPWFHRILHISGDRLMLVFSFLKIKERPAEVLWFTQSSLDSLLLLHKRRARRD